MGSANWGRWPSGNSPPDRQLTLPKNGTPGRIRTCDLGFRKAMLYPTELPGHVGDTAAGKHMMEYGKERNLCFYACATRGGT